MKLLNLDWSRWLYGMGVAVITGVSSSVLFGLGLKTFDPTVFNREVGTFIAFVASMALLGGVKDFFLYLHNHPLPSIISQDTHMDVKTTTLPQRGTGDGTVGNLPERTKTVKTTVEEEVKVAPKTEDR